MKIKTRKIFALLLIALIVFLCVPQTQVFATTKLCGPVSDNWIKCAKYQFKLSDDKILYCKYKKKKITIATDVNTAFVSQTDVLYKTSSDIRVYEAIIGTSYNVTMHYVDSLSNVAMKDVTLAGFYGNNIYYSAPASSKMLYVYDYKTGEVSEVSTSGYGYINKTYSLGNYIYIKQNTAAESNKTGTLSCINVIKGKTLTLSNTAISAWVNSKNVYFAEPERDLTNSLGIGTVLVKSGKIGVKKSQTLVKIENVDTNKTLVITDKFITYTDRRGNTCKYTFSNGKTTLYESYQQLNLLSEANSLY